nr:uncharacterized protein LOC119173397 [Rhipicephalus microplus]
MKAVLSFTIISIVLRCLLLVGDDKSANVAASNCEHKGLKIVDQLVQLQNQSVRKARLTHGGSPLHFAEVCPGACEEHKVGVWCSPGCVCRVMDAIGEPLFLCFEDGKPLPLGFH